MMPQKTVNYNQVELMVCDLVKNLPVEEKVDGVFSSLFFHWLTEDQTHTALQNIRASMKREAHFCGVQPLRKDINSRAYLVVLFRASVDFVGYPQRDFFVETINNSNFQSVYNTLDIQSPLRKLLNGHCEERSHFPCHCEADEVSRSNLNVVLRLSLDNFGNFN